ncbi:MAG TPA: COX15/CtaA family protein [Rudaea sp.]|nr:COX15/CtaA family protein [Rudaea sp.]
MVSTAQASKAVRRLAWLATAFALLVIVFGAFVRLSNAGLSCPDWPTCYGHVAWPQQSSAIAQADAAFPNRPVETHKAWREQTHRFLAGTLGLLVLALALCATWKSRHCMAAVFAAVVFIGVGIPLYISAHYVLSSVFAMLGELLLLVTALAWQGESWRRVAVLTLAVVCFQALLGMWTVTWLLKPIVVSAHLLGGMATFALLAWIASRISTDRFKANSAHLRVIVRFGVVLLACQIALGGWTSSNYAALACGLDFPTCLGHWWPAVDFHQGFVLWRGIGVDYEGGILDGPARTAIQIAHRIGAVLVFCYLAWLAHKISRAGLRKYAIALGALLLVQVLLGIGNVKLGLPLQVAVAHNAGAALLLFALVTLLARIPARDKAIA